MDIEVISVVVIHKYIYAYVRTVVAYLFKIMNYVQERNAVFDGTQPGLKSCYMLAL